MKHLTVNVDPERLKNNPELETQFIKMFGREKLNEVYSDDGGFDFTQEEIGNMSTEEFEQKHDEIMDALSKGRIN